MSQAEWEAAYKLAWETYYSDEHVERVLRRAAATKTSVGKTLFVLNWFVGSIRIEKIHPLEAGFVRLKYRRDRRSGFPIEPALTFYPRFIAETIAKQVRWAWLWGRTRRLYKSIRFGKGRYEYMDEFLDPGARRRGRDPRHVRHRRGESLRRPAEAHRGSDDDREAA